jgi:hypothetical protein
MSETNNSEEYHIPTIKEFWALSTEERKVLFEQHGIGYRFLAAYWAGEFDDKERD